MTTDLDFRQCDARYGLFVYPRGDYYIGGGLETYGEYSQQEVDVLVSFLKPGDGVVEVGAHIGTITVPLALAVGETGWVRAYEPQEVLRDLLFENTQRNAPGLVQVSAYALSDHDETLTYTPVTFNTGGVELRPLTASDTGAVVATAKLDDFTFNRLALLKIDVEGMECAVLKGAQQTILTHRPIISAENDRAHNSRELFDLLFAMGYRVWRHEPMLYNPNNFRGVKENLWGGTAALNIIAVPEDRDVPEIITTLNLVEVKPGQWATVCRFGGLGDNLIAAAPLPDLVRQGNHVEVITNKLAGEIFRNNPWIDKLSICADDDQPPGGGLEWQHWFQKRGHEVDGRLFHLSHTVETTLAFCEAQSQFWWPEALRRQVANVSYIELASSLCGTMADYYSLFYPTTMEKVKAVQTKAKMGDKVLGWVLCGSRIDKIYPQSAFVVARLIKELGISVMMIGKPGHDYTIAKLIEAHVLKQNGTLDGLHLAMTVEESDKGPDCDWPLRRSMTQLQICDLVITPDTGSAWAVAMEAVPKIVLLSHASPINITKHWRNTVALHADQKRVPCWPCHRLHDNIKTCKPNEDNTGVACMNDINPELIVSMAKLLLGGGDAARISTSQVTWS